jgi:hypothetical protein
MSHFVRPKRPRNRTASDATYDKAKIVSIIGNKAPILLHSMLKEIHECTAVGSERGASGLCGGGHRATLPTDMSDVRVVLVQIAWEASLIGVIEVKLLFSVLVQIG